MKVLLVGPSIQQKGGVASVIKNLHCFFKRNNINAKTIATTSQTTNKLTQIYSFARALFLIFILCFLNRKRIVHIHMASRGSCFRKTIIALMCVLTATPYVIHLHGGSFHVFFNKELNNFTRRVVRFAFIHACSVIALSSSWKAWLKSGMQLSNVTVIFNGVSAIQEQSKPHDNKSILFLGRIGKGKGVNTLLQAFASLRKKHPEAVLEIGGDGDIQDVLESASELEGVQLLGWIGNKDKEAALVRASVLCLPSWNEGLPMSILEAMGAGLPVVSTPVGGIPEAVLEGETGFLVPPGDVTALAEALSKLLSDSSLTQRMGEKAKIRHAELFSTEAMGESCLRLYEACLVSK